MGQPDFFKGMRDGLIAVFFIKRYGGFPRMAGHDEEAAFFCVRFRKQKKRPADPLSPAFRIDGHLSHLHTLVFLRLQNQNPHNASCIDGRNMDFFFFFLDPEVGAG